MALAQMDGAHIRQGIMVLVDVLHILLADEVHGLLEGFGVMQLMASHLDLFQLTEQILQLTPAEHDRK